MDKRNGAGQLEQNRWDRIGGPDRSDRTDRTERKGWDNRGRTDQV